MSARHRLTRRSVAALAVLTLTVTGLPAVATARPAGEGLGPRAEKFVGPPSSGPQEKFVQAPAPAAEPSTPAPTVVRQVVREEAVRALPIVLAGAALIIAIGGTGYSLLRVAPRHRLGGQH